MENKRTPLCLAPFISMYTNAFRLGPCCEYHGVDTRNISCYEAWNSDQFIEYRKAHYKGVFEDLPDVCKTCLTNNFSHSNYFSFHFPDEWENVKDDYDHITGKMDLKTIKEITIGMSNKCNLACVTCGSNHSDYFSRIYGVAIKDGGGENDLIVTDGYKVIKNEKYKSKEFIDETLPYLKTIFFHGGEPTLDNGNYEVFELIKKHKREDIKIFYTTNGTVFKFPNGKNLFETIKDFKDFNMTLSLDGMDDYLKYIRYPNTEKKLLRFINEWKKYNIENFYISIHFTLSNLSAINFADFLNRIEYYINNDIIPIRNISINSVKRPFIFRADNLPNAVKDKVILDIRKYLIGKINKNWPSWIRKEKIFNVIKEMKGIMFDERLWKKFLEYQKIIDNKRNLDLVDYFPILKDYSNDYYHSTGSFGPFD